MNVGDIVYIAGLVRVCVDTSGANWDFRDLGGGFDYFGSDTPYIFITNEKQLEDSIGQDLWEAYDNAVKKFISEEDESN